MVDLRSLWTNPRHDGLRWLNLNTSQADLPPFPGTRVNAFHFWRRIDFCRHPRSPHRQLEREFVFRPLRGVWQSQKRLQSLGEVRNRFQVGRARHGTLVCPLPEDNSLLREAGLGVVVGQQFGLRLDDLGEAFCQHLGNALVTLLTGALQQRLVCGLLDEGMFEEIACLRRTPPLLEQFSIHELRQPPL
jgi:hypothetical protein